MRVLIASTSFAVALAASTAFANNTDQETVSVTGAVVASLGLTQNSGVDMPDLVAGSDGLTSSVTLTCANDGTGTVAWGGNGNAFAAGTAAATTSGGAASDNTGIAGIDDAGSCGSISVAGEANFHYALTVTVGTSTDADNANVLLADADCTAANGTLVDASSGTGRLDGSGQDTLYCGATVTSNGADSAEYDDFDFTVAVVYD